MLLGLAGCAAGGATGAQPAASVDRYAADRADVMDRGPLPDPARMLADVELISFAYMTGSTLQRDTAHGAADVDRWLRDLRSRTVRSPRFGLRPTQVQICDSAAVEVGSFPISAKTAMDGLRRVRGTEDYLALWRPEADGWRLEALWLQPAGIVRPASLASGCGVSEIARRESRRFRFGVAFRGGGGAGLEPLVATLQEDWPDPSVTASGRGGPRVWLSYRPVPRFAFRSLYDLLLPASAGDATWDATSSRSVDVEVSAQQLSLLAEVALGPLWLGVGPAIAWVRVVESGHVVSRGGVSNHEEIERGRLLGGVAEATLRVTWVPTVVPILSLGYAWFPDLRPTLTDPAPVPLGGATLSAGLEWAF